MSALDHCPEPMTATVRPGVTARVIQAATKMLRAWRNRRHFRQLHEMSEFELLDIGLTPTDLQVARRAPLNADPTSELRLIAEARASAREEAARRIC